MMDICKENGAYDAKHFLCYYYYGGMIYTGLKNFERALYFYEQVIEREPQPHGQSFIQTDSVASVNSPLLPCGFRSLSSLGNNHSSHGSEPHHVGSLQEIHPGVTHSPRQSAAAAQIHLTDSRKIHQGKHRWHEYKCVCVGAADVRGPQDFR